MDDSCAVCADTLEWVAYGACGHREVCSTCVVRLRFICEDRRCCICKTESDVVFVTKALGDYTRMINNFAVLPSEPREGRNGSYWYHEDTQTFFDDLDHYKMIKAMCRLSCSVCDNMEETNDGTKRRSGYRNIEQLKGHLFHKHKLFMCSLCLEGRKVFIYEQKLYSRSQLNQHSSTGDSEVDGSESERGGFMGHPQCEFCKSSFYGDNELYSHMSRDHYTCHICERQHPGQYEYYRNYDDLEMHFRGDHFLCEDESCLAKKFVVFQSDSEMKRHNTIEHGGCMSRSKRNAALQACICFHILLIQFRVSGSTYSILFIPTSFRFHREQDARRGRGRPSGRDDSDNQLSMAIQASLDTSYADSPLPSSGTQTTDLGDDVNMDILSEPLDSLDLSDSSIRSRYLQALGHSRNAAVQQSAFPPLATGSNSSSSQQQKTTQEPEGLPNNSMAAHLRRKNKKATVVNSAKGWATTRVPLSGSVSSSSSQWPAIINNVSSSSHSVSIAPLPLSSHASPPVSIPGYISAGNLVSTNSRMSHSASAPSLAESSRLLKKPSALDFPPVSAMQVNKAPLGGQQQAVLSAGDVHTANKSLVEKIRDVLHHDEAKYASFKEISGQYRQGSVDTEKYLVFVRQYGLSHLVLELARLCPDPQKQKELVDTYNAASLGRNGRQEKGKDTNIKGKGIYSEGNSSARDKLTDNIMNTVRTLQSQQQKTVEEEVVEVLSKDGYRNSKGTSRLIIEKQGWESGGQPWSTLSGDGFSSHPSSKDGVSENMKKKKTSKFHRARLGDGSIAAILDKNNSDPDPDPGLVGKASSDGTNSNGAAGGLPVRGVWRKGGSKKLFA
ncbi:unnamed protein product [Linum tenue]|uniref:RING-type E3 ubiquitin transferase n=1 Tax=Linum tenue TaxID=586396 RepID=A0AAV0KS69_9ROSI|nr:unnamed protein product [Linum tenue]